MFVYIRDQLDQHLLAFIIPVDEMKESNLIYEWIILLIVMINNDHMTSGDVKIPCL